MIEMLPSDYRLDPGLKESGAVVLSQGSLRLGLRDKDIRAAPGRQDWHHSFCHPPVHRALPSAMRFTAITVILVSLFGIAAALPTAECSVSKEIPCCPPTCGFVSPLTRSLLAAANAKIQ
jgi:hypothetical protein